MKTVRKILMVLLVCAMIWMLSGCGGSSYSEFKWPNSELGKVLPQPDVKLKGEVTVDDDDMLMITIAKISMDDFDTYVNLCVDKGFTLDAYSNDTYYSANNEMGYELSVDYDEKDKTMTLNLGAYNVYGEFRWPDSEIAQLLPTPKSNYGSISWEASYGFVVNVAKTSMADFNEYVDSCKACGFTVDYRAGDDFYYANNESGYKLTLNYNDGDVMLVRLDEPDDESEDSESANESPDEKTSEETTPTEEPSSQDSESGIRPEFKDMMDSYEAFFDEYCEFMKKYSESDDTTSMLADYTDYMTKYVELMEKLNEVDEDELSTEEALYYAEVSARISQKLLEVAQ